MILWNMLTNAQFTLNTPDLTRLTWEYERNLLLGVPTNRNYGVLAIDLGSGAETAFYSITNPNGGKHGVHYYRKGDEIVVAADHQSSFGGAAIWNRATGENLQLDIEMRDGFSYDWAWSPDHRLFALSYGGGSSFVWDTLQLIGDAPHPYNIRMRRPASVLWEHMDLRFVDNDTLEGVKAVYRDTLEIYRWHVPTGEQVFYDKFERSICADTAFIDSYAEADLLRWGCSTVSQ